jgi:Domain of unknown function (DUF2383)
MSTQTPAPAVDTTTHDVRVLNTLLRGELAAVHTYDQVIPKFEGHPQAAELQRIRGEHAESAEALRDRVRFVGGTPVETGGAWAAFAAAVTGTAKVFGPAAALGAIKEGEDYGIGQYENALADPDVGAADKELVADQLLPRCKRHVADLQRMIEAVKK